MAYRSTKIYSFLSYLSALVSTNIELELKKSLYWHFYFGSPPAVQYLVGNPTILRTFCVKYPLLLTL